MRAPRSSSRAIGRPVHRRLHRIAGRWVATVLPALVLVNLGAGLHGHLSLTFGSGDAALSAAQAPPSTAVEAPCSLCASQGRTRAAPPDCGATSAASARELPGQLPLASVSLPLAPARGLPPTRAPPLSS